jgi:transcriptional regulator with XRE-family HTH domain
MPEYTEFGLEVRAMLLKKRKSMTKFAKELGISCSYLSEILRGTRDGKAYKDKIALLLGLTRKEEAVK